MEIGNRTFGCVLGSRVARWKHGPRAIPNESRDTNRYFIRNQSLRNVRLTHLQAPFPSFSSQKVLFTGGLSYDREGRLFRDNSAEVETYVGEPNEQIDHAWSKLILGQFLSKIES